MNPSRPTPGDPCAYIGPDADDPPPDRVWLYDRRESPGQGITQVVLTSLGVSIQMPEPTFNAHWAVVERGSRWHCPERPTQPEVVVCAVLDHHHRGAICVNPEGHDASHVKFDLLAFTTNWRPTT